MTKSIGSLLAFAVTTSIALANGGGDDDKKNPYQGGSSWKPGAGITLADSEEFKLTLSGYLQVQWQFQALDNLPDTNNFVVRRARTTFAGHVFNKDLMYRLTLDATDSGAGNGPIKDGWAQWTFSKGENGNFGVRVGQSKTYFGLESTGTSSGLYFVERSAATRTFADSRTRGAWIFGSHSENKIRWNAGAQNTDVANGARGILENGEETNNADNELNFVANVSFDPMGDITGGKTNESIKQGDLGDIKDTMGTIGGGIEVGNNRNLGNTQDVDALAININTAWMLGQGITVQGEVFLRSDDPQNAGATEDSTGWYVQGTYTLPKNGNSEIQWGFGLRVNSVNTDNTNAFVNTIGAGGQAFGGLLAGQPGDVTEVTGVVDAFYHGHAAKTQFEYTWQDTNPDTGTSSTNHIIRIMFQVMF